jgi:hypothetical protein
MIIDRLILIKAQKLWEQAGKPKGQAEKFWRAAQQEIEQMLQTTSYR